LFFHDSIIGYFSVKFVEQVMSHQIFQVPRHGAYGVLMQDARILLTLKKSKPYQGLWGLPGGAIEFGETPEQTLQRELAEEVALEARYFELWTIASFVGEHQCLKKQLHFRFHHIGVIFKVKNGNYSPPLSPKKKAVGLT
jgi:ADP-ribose pyrophosphatase YjhB (NUDIX family)